MRFPSLPHEEVSIRLSRRPESFLAAIESTPNFRSPSAFFRSHVTGSASASGVTLRQSDTIWSRSTWYRSMFSGRISDDGTHLEGRFAMNSAMWNFFYVFLVGKSAFDIFRILRGDQTIDGIARGIAFAIDALGCLTPWVLWLQDAPSRQRIRTLLEQAAREPTVEPENTDTPQVEA